MGAFDVVGNVEVPDDNNPDEAVRFRKKWKWEPHEKVIMRGTFLAADHEAVQNAMSPSTPVNQGKQVKELGSRIGSGQVEMLHRMIVDWTLSSNGRKVEVTPQAIRRLPSNYMTPLLEKCDEIAATLTEEEQEDFLPGVSEPTQASS